jgi:hypothetical protein
MTENSPLNTKSRFALLFSALFIALSIFLPVGASAQSSAFPPTITSDAFALGTVGQPFTYTIRASGSPTSFGASALPNGLVAPAAGSAIISGLPQAAGVFTSSISAANAAGATTNSLFLLMNPPPAPVLASPVTVFAVQGQALNYPLLSSPSHSNVPTTFSVSGLPTGATLSTTVTTNTSFTNVVVTNYFINSPSLLTNGSFIVPVVLSNAGGVSTNNVTFIINGTSVPVFATTNFPVTATVGVNFSADLTAINSPLRFRVTGIQVGANPLVSGLNITNGPLVNGLRFSNVTTGSTVVGRIFGTPGATNSLRFVVEAANNFGTATNTNVVINVGNPAPTIVLSQPLGEGFFVTGSSFYLNAQVFDDPEGILLPSSFGFLEGPAAPPTTAVAGTVGILGEYFGIDYYPNLVAPVVGATAQNALGVGTNSLAFAMDGRTPRAPFPTIEMLPLSIGQQLVAGGIVTLSAKATIPSTRATIDRVEFYVNKVYVGSSPAPVNNGEVYEFEWTTPPVAGSYQVTARAVSVNFTTGALEVPGNTPFWASVIARKPTIVNIGAGTAPSVAVTVPANNGTLLLNNVNPIKAEANLAGGFIQSVEFFVNGQRIATDVVNPSTGLTTTQSNPDAQYPFEVLFVPNAPGTYEFYAIATGSNGLQTVSPVVRGVVNGVSVPTIPTNPPAGSNSAFVLEMYNSLLYDEPTYEEWLFYTQALDTDSMDRATVVMNIMGYDAQRKIFNRGSAYGRTSFSAMMPYYRLGLTPSLSAVQSFIAAIESGSVTYVNATTGVTTVASGALPITGGYSGIPDSPWGATYGYARGMQENIANSTQFRSKYPTANGFDNTSFLNWMRPKMFRNVSGGDEDEILNMMNTIAPQSIRQGAAMAFRSELASVALQAGYMRNPELNQQSRAGTVMLNFQLSGKWVTRGARPYSKKVVQNILAQAGYITLPARAAGK